MISRFFTGLRTRILLLVFLAFLPVFALTLSTGYQQRRLAAAAAQEDALRLVRLGATDYIQILEAAHQLLITLTQLPFLRDRDSVACSAFLAQLLKQHRAYANLVASAPDGAIFCSALPLRHPVNVADQEVFRRVLEKRSFVISNYTIGPISGKPIIAPTYPLLDDAGQVQAIVSTPLDLTYLNQFFAQSQLPPNSMFALVDRYGKVLIHYPEPEKWAGKTLPISSSALELLKHQREGTAEAVGLDNISRLYAFSMLRGILPLDEARLVVGIPREIAFAGADSMQTRNLIWLGVVVTLTFMAAWVGSDRIVLRNVRYLVNATQRLAAGDMSVRTSNGGGAFELRQLAHAFNDMVGVLEQREGERKQAEELLRQQEERYRLLFEQASTLIVVSTLDGVVTDVNLAAERILGWSREEMIGLSTDQLLTPTALALGKAHLPRFLKENRVSPLLDFEVVKKDGALAILEGQISILHDAEGNPVSLEGVYQDVTDRKRIERGLKVYAHQQSVLAELSQLALQDLSLSLLMTKITARVAHALEVEYCKVLELLPGGEALLLRAGVGWKKGYVGLATVGSEKHSQAGYTLFSREPVIVEDLRNETRFSGPALLHEHDVISGISVTIPGHDRPFGVLGVHTTTLRRFSADDVHFFQAVANILAAAIERQRVEAALRESETQFRSVTETLPIAIFLYRGEELLYVNPATAALTGATPEELLATPAFTFVHPDFHQLIHERQLARLEGKALPSQFELKIVRKNGEERWVQLTLHLGTLFLAGARVHLGSAIDITERKRDEEALRQAYQRLQSYIAYSPLAIIEWDIEMRVVSWSPQAERLFGWKAEEVLGKHPGEWGFVYEGDVAEVYAELERVFAGISQRLSFNNRNYTKDGRVVSCEWYGSVLRDIDGRVTSFLSLVLDITDRTRAEEEVRNSEQRLRHLLNGLGPTMFVGLLSPEGMLLEANRSVLEVTKLRFEDVVGKPVEELYPWSYVESLQQQLRDAVQRAASGETVRFDCEIRITENRFLIVDFCLSPLFDEKTGKVLYLIPSAADITSRKQAEEALRRSQASLEAAQARAHLGSWEIDFVTKSGFWSKEMFNLYRRDPALGPPKVREFFELVHPKDRQRLSEQYARALQNGEAGSENFRTNPELGPFRVFNMHFYPEKDAQGRIRRIVGTTLDITERHQAEEAVRESERKRTAELLSLAHSLSAEIPLEVRLPDMCRRTAELIGCDRSSIFLREGQYYQAKYNYGNPPDIAALFPQHKVRLHDPLIVQAMTTRNCVVVNDALHSPLMNVRTAILARIQAIVVAPFLDDSGEPMGFITAEYNEHPGSFTELTASLVLGLAKAVEMTLITDRNRTARLRVEEEIRQLNVTLEQRVIERTAQLTTANQDLETFSYSISHDLRAPLRAISGFAQIIARRHRPSLNEEGQHYVDNIVDASARMGQLIDELLQYARLGRKAVVLQPVSLHTILTTVVKDLSSRINQTGAQLRLPDTLPLVRGAPTLLGQVFINLLDNALLYHRPGTVPHVTVSCQAENGHVRICVADNGLGISPEYHEKIFTMFQRLQSQEAYPGTGVGLAIVKKATELMGGQVWVESEVGKGSTFFVELQQGV